ncbi:MAG: mercury methylation corrinoid protein HgcA [Deferrisomatales bacterium]|nr:mercury methylation corrinoid protein HgcA [Deferrisomatales bacterium]
MSRDEAMVCCALATSQDSPPSTRPAAGDAPAQAPCCAVPAPPPSPESPASCCPGPSSSGPRPEAGGELPGYRRWPFVEGWIDTPVGPVPRVRSRLDATDVLGRWQMRWGIGRDRYRLAPGLYAVGRPGGGSPVLVTANYKMTFDLLRRDLAGLDAWILVLETYGINVWCAAGKGTFGTAEVVRRVRATGLSRVVSHRRLLLPQLGAPGVAAHEVRRECGFSVVFGPVRSADIGAFLGAGMAATPAMRTVTFTALERFVLTPVELAGTLRHAAWVAAAIAVSAGFGPGFYSLSGAWIRGVAGVAALAGTVVAGAVATPVLLPLLPWRAFSAKGALVGAAVALLGVAAFGFPGGYGFLALLLGVSAGSSYLAMSFTGATPFTSPSGVEREMRRALPWQVGAAALAVVFWFASAF